MIFYVMPVVKNLVIPIDMIKANIITTSQALDFIKYGIEILIAVKCTITPVTTSICKVIKYAAITRTLPRILIRFNNSISNKALINYQIAHTRTVTEDR